jgi:hypothetical protein
MKEYPPQSDLAVNLLHGAACAIRELRRCYAKGSEARITSRVMQGFSYGKKYSKTDGFSKLAFRKLPIWARNQTENAFLSLAPHLLNEPISSLQREERT